MEGKKLDGKTLNELREKFLNKKVTVRGYTGLCTFLGYNKFLPEWELEIVVERTPITNVEVHEIKLYEQ